MNASDRIYQIKIQNSLRTFVSEEMDSVQSGPKDYDLYICPFHADSNPSLVVYESYFQCQGCGERGDIIDWIQKRTGMSFWDAVESMERDGMIHPMPTRTWANTLNHPGHTVGSLRLKSTLQAITEEGQRRFRGSPAEAYAESRGWTEAVQDNFRMGYLPFNNHILELPCFQDVEALKELKLLNADARPWCRGRLMFPITVDDEPVAIATRSLAQKADVRYINSGRTILFSRNEVLYGADMVLMIQPSGVLIVAEGYADVWSAFGSGYSAVAIMGTQAKSAQIDMINDIAGAARIFIVMDGDEAGQNGAVQLRKELEQRGARASVIDLPDGEDLSSMIETERWNDVFQKQILHGSSSSV